jgi:predicted Zn-dependent protease
VRLARCIVVVLLPLLASCALNPVSKTPELVLTTSEREVEIGTQAAREVEDTVGVVRDPKLADYVSAVGARIAALSPRQDVEYHFAVVEMGEPNAFALPGGYIFVSRGIVELFETEDELAGVLAHEVIHVAARHAVQRQTAALPVGILSALGSLAGGLVGGQQLARVVGGIPQFAGGLVLAGYGRDQEREADRLGQKLVAEAGWDPGALADALERMERVVAVEVAAEGGEQRSPSWFDSHPSTPERVSSARSRAEHLARGASDPIAAGRLGFLQQIEGMRAGPDPAEGVFHKELFLHPDLGFAVRFPLEWRTHNGREVVAASAPSGDAVVAVRLQARGDDPEAAAVAFARKKDMTLSDFQRFRVNGLPAVRALAGVKAGRGNFVGDFSFIAHQGVVYRITGAAPVQRYDYHAREIVDVVRSFRDLEPDERSFQVGRLRLASANPGERLSILGARTGNSWSVARTAAVNGLDPSAPLAAGRLVKIAVSEPYAPSPPAR